MRLINATKAMLSMPMNLSQLDDRANRPSAVQLGSLGTTIIRRTTTMTTTSELTLNMYNQNNNKTCVQIKRPQHVHTKHRGAFKQHSLPISSDVTDVCYMR